jgi:hypothetical protein
MIERYTIKFGPAVSQKELEKALHEATDPEVLKKLHKMKARIEVVGDFDDLKKISDLLGRLSHHGGNDQPSIS